MAEACEDPGVASIHRDMAALYEKFIAQFGDQPSAPPPLNIAGDDPA